MKEVSDRENTNMVKLDCVICLNNFRLRGNKIQYKPLFRACSKLSKMYHITVFQFNIAKTQS